MTKTYYYSGRVKSQGNICAALKTDMYHGKKCVDIEGFTYEVIGEDAAKKFWKIFDFDLEVGKVMSEDDAEELADFCDLSDIDGKV
jgi:hypothetical protein